MRTGSTTSSHQRHDVPSDQHLHDGAGPAVVNRLRVRGLEGLRVIDASIMPAVVSGNTKRR